MHHRYFALAVIALLPLLLLPTAPAGAEEPPVVQALEQLAEGRVGPARKTLGKDDAPGSLAPVLVELVAGYEEGDGRRFLNALHRAEDVEAAEFDAALVALRRVLTSDLSPDALYLRELWCHLWSLHPQRPDPQATRDAARIVDPESGIVAPIKRLRFMPSYPASGRADRVIGDIVLRTTINGNGCVVGTEVAKSLREDMDRAAADAIRWWTFEPAVDESTGRPIPVHYHLTVNFTLEGPNTPRPRWRYR